MVWLNCALSCGSSRALVISAADQVRYTFSSDASSRVKSWHFGLGFADLTRHLLLQIDQRLDGFVTEFKRFDHHIFADLTGAAFDHQESFAGAGQTQVEVGVLEFFDRSG